MGQGLSAYCQEPELKNGELSWRKAEVVSADTSVLRGVADPFQQTGGLNVLEGPLGRAVIKASSIPADRHVIEAPARIFHSQEELAEAFKRGELHKDVVAVVRFQGPKANGMPELHRMTPPLAVLQDLGFRVALITDGRMSGASGKIPAAIHVTPEAADGGAIAKLRDGDVIRLDCDKGTIKVLVDAREFAARPLAQKDLSANEFGVGRELFASFRKLVGAADAGATIFGAV
jgi:phosphogluconate dehydratase